ncbi:hypothetical protein ACQPWY_24710 [Pseudonocardia xinjiangensis]|uniref:hypothetical protein n=1 Tax=Pseudonocardia xinjiangensis TaxID=75289 RepID=UPI003D92FB1C
MLRAAAGAPSRLSWTTGEPGAAPGDRVAGAGFPPVGAAVVPSSPDAPSTDVAPSTDAARSGASR